MELLRLAAFFSNTALTAQLCAWLGGQLAGLSEKAVVEVGAVAMPGRGAAEHATWQLPPQMLVSAAAGVVF